MAPPLVAGTTNVSAGNAVVPAGYVRQVGIDGFMDSGAWNYFTAPGAAVPSNPAPGAWTGFLTADHPTSWWRLDDKSSPAKDFAGSNNATFGAGVTVSVPGAIEDGHTAMSFDGVAGFLEVGAPSSLISLFQNHDFSVEFWAKPTSVINYVFTAGQFNNAGTRNFLHLGFSAGKLFFGMFGDDQSGVANVTAGAFHHCVFTWSNSSRVRSLYLDGALDISTTAGGSFTVPSAADIQIARVFFATGNGPFFYNGVADEVAVYNYALTAAQVFAHFQSANAVVRGFPQVNIFVPGTPYFTGGWPPDPLAGQPYHTAPNVNRKDGIND